MWSTSIRIHWWRPQVILKFHLAYFEYPGGLCNLTGLRKNSSDIIIQPLYRELAVVDPAAGQGKKHEIYAAVFAGHHFYD